MLIGAWLLAKLCSHQLRKALPRVSRSEPTNQLIVAFTSIAIGGFGLFVALGALGLDKTVTTLLAGVGIFGLAIGLAFQSTGENLVSGVYLSIREPFTHGQWIESNDIYGKVERIALRET